MSIPRSRELSSVISQARDIARNVEKPLNSAHLLLALYTIPNGAESFLKDRNVTVDGLLDACKSLPGEPGDIMEQVWIRSERIATGSSSEVINSLHLLAALLRERKSQARQLLEGAGVNVSAMRASVMSYATGSRALPRRKSVERLPARADLAPAVAKQVEDRREHAPSPIGFHPGLGLASESKQVEARGRTSVTTIPPATKVSEPVPEEIVEQGTVLNPASGTDFEPWHRRRPRPAPGPTGPEKKDERKEAIDEARKTARKLAESLFRRQEQLRDIARCKEKEEARTDPGVDEAVDTPGATLPPPPITTARSDKSESTQLADDALADRYLLDEEEFPFLSKHGRNLCAEAARGLVDRVIGREKEVLQLVDIIGKRRSNNPMLIGEAGVGKTAIVEGLALHLVDLQRGGVRLGQKTVIELEVGRILSGTHLRGSLSERLTTLKEEVKRANGKVIVFLDEIHTWLSSQASGDGADAASELKAALARGHFPCIGATTADEFRSFVENDPAFERRFEVVYVEEPDAETALEILVGIQAHYEEHHGIRYTQPAVDAAVRLSQRFLHERRLPDKAIGVMDLAGSRAARTGVEIVDRDEVASIVAELASIPAERLTRTDRERFLHMEDHLAKGIVGHQPIIKVVSDVIRRNYAGFHSSRPVGSFLFLGPTGVGKTEFVKVLADFLFFDRDAFIRFDMSEFMEAHAVSRLVGAPPGYVGHEAGGQLTEAVRRRPYQVVLFDEIEKAHPDVCNVLLQLLDEGRLTDGRGRTVDFSACVIVMTSNLGANVYAEQARTSRIGFGEGGGVESGQENAVIESARGHFPPELWNRMDEKLVFSPLTRSEVARIAALQLGESSRRLMDENGIKLVLSDTVIPWLVENGGYDVRYGARPMRSTISRHVEGAVARLILAGDATRGDCVYVDTQDGELNVWAEG